MLLSYGTGTGNAPAGLEILRTSRRLSPRGLRSGPSPGKPLADAALLGLLVGAHRRGPFEAVLAHNVEATAVAIAARPVTRAPVVYVAHTLLRHELASYGGFGPAADRLGAVVDRALARRADAVIALCEATRRALEPFARGPVRRIPPGLAPAPPPTSEQQRVACRRHALAPGGFALYTGNHDGYQDLAELEGVARAAGPGAWPLVVASHDAASPAKRGAASGLRHVRVSDFPEMRALGFAAAALVLPRRRPGGFPVKLLNYMETGRPIVARRGVADELSPGRDALLLADGAGPDDFARALEELRADPALAASLGRAARQRLQTRHAWPALAAETLALIELLTLPARAR